MRDTVSAAGLVAQTTPTAGAIACGPKVAALRLAPASAALKSRRAVPFTTNLQLPEEGLVRTNG
jgi:hypothetical protein